ncbi:MAG: CAP domain-containing protein [Cytophagales bacterium]|nr:CAP domain-containing protein [Cytophagales bacterium]
MKKFIHMLGLLLVILCIQTMVQAQPARMAGMLERHNHWRKAVGVPPMKWSVKLALQAQAWADSQAKRGDCACKHSTDTMYGENIYCSQGIASKAGDVADSWASEKKFYNHTAGKCKGGECGHYTQMVWRTTTEVGCGMARCGDKEIWVCNYNPPGNYINKKAY